ncbi:MAG TPA: thioredoxin domain-containing protein, partial [Parafilimonas sp.]|nr:thioredoxin domain-containing protein [Parafilimonas sp.]
MSVATGSEPIMNEKHTNHLIKETSPYLLQHAHNPVDWHPWGEEALEKARSADKPILVSIGYSACHWCHVMERESFEDEETAALMNESFINIKIDREERPDLDHIYMDAVQAMTGSGGWPLNVFLTPALKPFFGGTYFPPVRAFNRSSWKEVVIAVASAYRNKKNEIEEQAETLVKHLVAANNLQGGATAGGPSDRASLQTIADNLLKTADKEWGGFGNPPKFPHTFSILYLLRHYHFFGHKPSLEHAVLSLDKLMMGGIYDQLGGGFARYATDRRWQIPHFEKMLYDNALLLEAFTEAYQLTKKKDYAKVIHDTIGFLQREMMSAAGGFYSALDADSEGVEGKYYTWGIEEVRALLGDESETFCDVFDVSKTGNWEQTNILWMPEPLENFSDGKLGDWSASLEGSKAKLFEARQQRIRPGLDDKIILGWNALMIKSLCKAYAATGEQQYRQLAELNISFLEKNLQKNEEPFFYHSWNKKINSQEAFIDDYA